LVRCLPPEATLVRRHRGDADGWTVDTYLLALVADGILAGNWQRQGKRSAKKPERVPRPERPEQAPRRSTLSSEATGRLLDLRERAERRRREVTADG